MPNREGGRKANNSGGSESRERSRSPISRDSRSDAGSSLSIEDLKKIVIDSIAQQMPKMIIETSKVVKESLSLDREESSKFSAEMKQIKMRQEDLATLSKAASLSSQGDGFYKIDFINFRDNV